MGYLLQAEAGGGRDDAPSAGGCEREGRVPPVGSSPGVEDSIAAPLWLSEGMAWYFEAIYTRSQGPTHFFSRESLWWAARGWDVPLRAMERQRWHYGLGYLAIEQLVERSSEEALFDFYRSLSSDTTWQDAFEESFGLTVGAFYEEFEEWRAREVPPQVFYSGAVLDPDGNPMEDIHATVLWERPRPRPGGEGRFQYYESWISVTGADGRFKLPAFPTPAAVIYFWTRECSEVGILARDGGITQDGSRARIFETGLEGVSDIVVTMPAQRDQLCTPQTANSFFASRELGWGWR